VCARLQSLRVMFWKCGRSCVRSLWHSRIESESWGTKILALPVLNCH
jgi:hypothetical protein